MKKEKRFKAIIPLSLARRIRMVGIWNARPLCTKGTVSFTSTDLWKGHHQLCKKSTMVVGAQAELCVTYPPFVVNIPKKGCLSHSHILARGTSEIVLSTCPPEQASNNSRSQDSLSLQTWMVEIRPEGMYAMRSPEC